MKNNKILGVMLSSFFALMMFAGCTAGNTGMNGSTTQYNNSATNSAGSNYNSSMGYKFNYSGLYREYSPNPTGYYETSVSAKSKQEGDAAYSLIKKISGIEDVKIAIINDKAYCAVKTSDSAKSLQTKKKARINNIIKIKYPQVKYVYFSDKVKHYESLGTIIGNGLEDVKNDVLNLFEM